MDRRGKSFNPLEEAMNKGRLEENKARWALFEQMSPTSSAVIWAAVAVVVVLAAIYLFM
jgi:hypothetical protein